jgi:futalosine hydrolase
VTVLICVATELEASLLRDRLPKFPDARLVVTGVGPVNAAHAATVAIMEQPPDAILVCGVGGAYPASGLQVGDVVSANVEIYGDLGAQSPSGFLDMKALGFPIVDSPAPLFNEIPMQVFPTETRGRFVTVSTCTGTESSARALEARTKGVVENMEGAAVAHVAHLHRIPVGEVRAISNIVTNRDTKSWRLKEASIAAQNAVIVWLENSSPQVRKPLSP